ncbi:hypothetical protein FBQ98_11945 [Gammaproteobacteria bacterium PRO6]|nr:hypothetical protein [Gammaproteobacteria bacterium PRO6]
MRKLPFLLFLAACPSTYASPIEVWECAEYYQRSEILVTATVDEGRTSGSILVAGVKHNAQFEVKGFDRRWDFGLARDGTFDYAFIISPNGDGRYYDFSHKSEAKPGQFMNCRQKKNAGGT